MSGIAQLLQNAVYGTALILAAALLRRVLKGRLMPGARLVLWAVCLFRLLTPAAPESVLSLWRFFRPRQAPAVSTPPPVPAPAVGTPQVYTPTQTIPITAPVDISPVYTPQQTASAPQPAPGIPWETVLLAVWLAVGTALAVWYVVSWTRTRRAVARTIPVDGRDPRYASLPKCARLREGPMEGAPLTFGAVRPTVVLTPGLRGEALDCVLAHEGVHAMRRDNLWHYAMALALVVHWWNPAVWLMARLLRRDIELSCDRAAVRKLGPEKRADYARTLVSLATQGGSPAFSHTFSQKLTEERIVAIMKYKKMTALGLALSLLLVSGVTAAFATEPVEPKSEPTPEPDPEPTASVCVQDYFDSVSGLTEGELAQLVPHLEQMRQSLFESFKQAGESDLVFERSEQLAARSDCPHFHSTSCGRGIFYISHDELTHMEIEEIYRSCSDCFTVYVSSRTAKISSHSFGAYRYASSDHSAANPAKHFAVYSHTCPDCNNTYSYTSPLGCTQSGCVDLHSVTPEPEVNSAGEELKANLEALWKEHIQAEIKEYLKTYGVVRTSSGPYGLCEGKDCAVS